MTGFALDQMIGQLRRNDPALSPDPPVPLELSGYVLKAPGDHSVIYTRSDGTDPVFRVFADRIEAYSSREEDIQAMVSVMSALGWGRACLSGREDFLHVAFLKCRIANIETSGYDPTPLEEEHAGRIGKSLFPELG